jgi:hypothetical protein
MSLCTPYPNYSRRAPGVPKRLESEAGLIEEDEAGAVIGISD